VFLQLVFNLEANKKAKEEQKIKSKEYEVRAK